jgi:NAD+ kinase
MAKPRVCFVANKRHGISVPKDIDEVSMRESELIVVFGGDGMILRTFRQMSEQNLLHIPLFGVNKGSVGFMSNDIVECHGKRFRHLIEWIVMAKYTNPIFEHRSLLDITVGERYIKALNEVTIHPKKLGCLLNVDMTISNPSDNNIVSMKGDGVIVSTSTGSTAYNLSAGGPILMPYMDALVVTPMNPFTMAARTIILDKRDYIILSTRDKHRVVVDGMEIKGASKIEIRLSKDKLNLVRASSFFDAIQSKLGWNRSIK